MPETTSATSCPHCGKELKVPPELHGKVLRCKGCTKTFVAGQTNRPKTTTSTAPVRSPASTPLLPDLKPAASLAGVKSPLAATPRPSPARLEDPDAAAEPSPFVRQMVRRQRTGMYVFFALLVIAFGSVGIGVFLFRDQLQNLFASGPKPAPSQPVRDARPPLLVKDLQVDDRDGDLTGMPPKEEGTKRPRRNFARIPAPYPGRALLVGVRNYLYLNPLNPGYREDRSLRRDPLGLITLRRLLVSEHSFPRDQAAVLSDVDDQKPMQPTRAAIEANIEEFLKTSRPSDRIILAFVGHATVLGDQAYLLPIDAELPPDGAKPDAERDGKLAKNLIPLKWLYEKLAACPARQKLVIFDIAQEDPEAGIIRSTPGRLDDKLYAQLKAVPKNTQVWLACQAKQSSHLFASSSQDGSVFLEFLAMEAAYSNEEKWKVVQNHPGLKAGTLPLLLVADQVAKATAQYVKRSSSITQSPELIGSEPKGDFPAAADAPAPVTLTVIRPTGELVPAEELKHVLQELQLEHDPARMLPPASFPPILKSAFAAYGRDYKNTVELQAKVKDMPLRAATLKAIQALNNAEKSFKMRFEAPVREAEFKKSIEREQEVPAFVTSELSEILDEMKALEEKRDEEPSKRWQAHFDYTQARILARLAHVQEYGFVLGNKLRKDTPPIKDPRHNGWIIVPQRKLEQKETRTYDAERQKLCAKIIKEHPGTPWEILARREQATILGLTLQEANLQELRR